MKRFSTYVLVAAMAVGGAGIAVGADNDNMTSGNQMQQLGGQQADASVQREVRSTLAKVVNDAVDNNKFDNLNGYLAKADKDRLTDMKKMNVDDLNNAIKQFRADFKNKYNQDFDIQNEHLNNVLINAGQDKKSATATLANADFGNAGALNSTGTTGTDINRTDVNKTTSTYTPQQNNQAGMTNGAPADRTLNTAPGDVTVSNRNGQLSGAADNGTTSGKATGPASSGSNANSSVHGNDVNANPGIAHDNNTMATGNTVTSVDRTSTSTINNGSAINGGLASAGGLTLNLVNEGHVMNAWRIDVPDQISADQLKANLIKHIQMLDDQKATWPSDVNAAYRSTAYHVLQAFSDSSLASER